MLSDEVPVVQTLTEASTQDRIKSVQAAITHVWIFLEEYLDLANTHGAEFISHGHWNGFVPLIAQQQLLSLSHDELVSLPHCMASGASEYWGHIDSSENVESENEQNWLYDDFIGRARSCRLENLEVLSELSELSFGQTEDRGSNVSVVSEAMCEKKLHEVNVMTGVVAAMVRSCDADIVVDVGSGRGYLSCELARQYNMPVLGLDSLDTNTHSALRRDEKLGRRWNGLARRKEQRKTNKNKQSSVLKSDEENITEQKSDEGPMVRDNFSVEETSTAGDTRHGQNLSVINSSQFGDFICSQTDVSIDKLSVETNEIIESEDVSDDVPDKCIIGSKSAFPSYVENNPKTVSVPQSSDSDIHDLGVISNTYNRKDSIYHSTFDVICPDITQVSDMADFSPANKQEVCENVCSASNRESRGRFHSDAVPCASKISGQIDNSSRKREAGTQYVTQVTPTNSSHVSGNGNSDRSNTAFEGHNRKLKRNIPQRTGAENETTSLYVPLTLFVHPRMNLRQVICDSAGHLCKAKSPSDFDFLLTGLHTCGSLAVTLMNLFTQDPGAVGLCYVGCCYQLMEEADLGGSVASVDASESCHFPLSQYGKELGLHLGRNARNLASQSLHRTGASGQLQGKEFFWRALLDVLLRELDIPVPERILGMRGLNKRSKSFKEYALVAFGKLQLSPHMITEDILDKVENQHRDDQRKMAAFFQLKLVLSPAIEALILLDRLLFLLEQECLEWVHLVQLFDPLMSPRCFAFVAKKIKCHN